MKIIICCSPICNHKVCDTVWSMAIKSDGTVIKVWHSRCSKTGSVHINTFSIMLTLQVANDLPFTEKRIATVLVYVRPVILIASYLTFSVFYISSILFHIISVSLKTWLFCLRWVMLKLVGPLCFLILVLYFHQKWLVILVVHLNMIMGHMVLTSLILQGSAVIWFNLLKSGEEDTRTLHAACPVFVGSKWGKFAVNTSP